MFAVSGIESKARNSCLAWTSWLLTHFTEQILKMKMEGSFTGE